MVKDVTVIVPAYNESEAIIDTILGLKSLEGIAEIIVVDDGSTDDTYELIKNLHDIKIICNNKNMGKGYCIKAALPYVKTDYILLADADLGSTSQELRKLVENTKRGRQVMLAALYPKPLHKGGFGMVKKLSSYSLYMLTSQKSDTILSGQRLVYSDFLRQLILPDGFAIEFKVTLEALRKGIRIVEVPVNIRHRETGRNINGFIHRGKQFFSILKVVIKEMM